MEVRRAGWRGAVQEAAVAEEAAIADTAVEIGAEADTAVDVGAGWEQ